MINRGNILRPYDGVHHYMLCMFYRTSNDFLHPSCSWCTNHVITQCGYLFNYSIISFSKSYLKFATSDTYWHICLTRFG